MDISRMPEARRSQIEAAMSRKFDNSDSSDDNNDEEESERPLR